MNPRPAGRGASMRSEDPGLGMLAGAPGAPLGLTWSWMGSLLGPSVRLVEKSTAHFSSVTDSVPFRSHRLIFFRSWGWGEGEGGEGRNCFSWAPHTLSRTLAWPEAPAHGSPKAPHQVLEQRRAAVPRDAVLQGHGVVDDLPRAFSARASQRGAHPDWPRSGRSLSPQVNGLDYWSLISTSLLGFLREKPHLSQSGRCHPAPARVGPSPSSGLTVTRSPHPAALSPCHHRPPSLCGPPGPSGSITPPGSLLPRLTLQPRAPGACSAPSPASP